MTTLLKRSTSVLPAAALALFCFADQVSAAGTTWKSSGTDFNTAGNWSGSSIPGSSDHIVFDGVSTGINPNLSSSATVKQILFSTATSSGWTLSSSSSSEALTLTSIGTGATAGTGAAIYAANTSGTNTISAPLVLGAAPTGSQRIDVLNAGGPLVISGEISGSIGTLTKGENGTLSLTGNNTFTATVSIANGVLIANADTAFGNSVNAITLAGGTLRFGSAFDVSARTITVASSGRIDTNGFNVTLAHPIGNGGAGTLRKDGNGTLTLTGVNTYTGATTIKTGTLLINGSVTNGGITVSSGTKLGGDLTAGGTTTVSSGGTLAVGNGAGLGTFASLSLAGTTEIQFNAGANSADRGTSFDGINVTNSGGLAYGGVLNLVFAGALSDGQTFDLFDLAGTSSGSFSSVKLFAGATSIGTLTNDNGLWSGTFDLALGSGAQTFTFSEATGDMAVVPEPSILALFTLGLIFTARRMTIRMRLPA